MDKLTNQKVIRKWDSDILQFEWYSDKKQRTWVILDFLYQDGIKHKIRMLQMGTRFDVMLLYDDVMAEIQAGTMKILTKNN